MLAALERGFGSVAVVPVHPAPDAVAIRILIRAVKGGRAPLVLHPGFALQDADGNVPQKVQAVLGGTAVLPLADS